MLDLCGLFCSPEEIKTSPCDTRTVPSRAAAVTRAVSVLRRPQTGHISRAPSALDRARSLGGSPSSLQAPGSRVPRVPAVRGQRSSGGGGCRAGRWPRERSRSGEEGRRVPRSVGRDAAVAFLDGEGQLPRQVQR